MTTTDTDRPRLGRPPSPKDQVRGNRIVTFLTNRQLRNLRKMAERDGTSLSQACYRVLRLHLD